MKILIVYYSLYGHVFKLAEAVKEGAESVKGAEVLFRRVEEFDWPQHSRQSTNQNCRPRQG